MGKPEGGLKAFVPFTKESGNFAKQIDPISHYLFPKKKDLKKPKVAGLTTPEKAAKQAALAADKAKKNALGAYGSEDTILTGPLGLNQGTPEQNKGYKTLLGA